LLSSGDIEVQVAYIHQCDDLAFKTLEQDQQGGCSMGRADDTSIGTKDAIPNTWTSKILLGPQYRTQKHTTSKAADSCQCTHFCGHKVVLTIVEDLPGMRPLEPEVTSGTEARHLLEVTPSK